MNVDPEWIQAPFFDDADFVPQEQRSQSQKESAQTRVVDADGSDHPRGAPCVAEGYELKAKLNRLAKADAVRELSLTPHRVVAKEVVPILSRPQSSSSTDFEVRYFLPR